MQRFFRLGIFPGVWVIHENENFFWRTANAPKKKDRLPGAWISTGGLLQAAESLVLLVSHLQMAISRPCLPFPHFLPSFQLYSLCFSFYFLFPYLS